MKGHFLRFLGMYNVMDLLTFTIATDVLFNCELAEEWTDVLIIALAMMTAFSEWRSHRPAAQAATLRPPHLSMPCGASALWPWDLSGVFTT